MKSEDIETILDRLADGSVKAKNHFERRKYDKAAYGFIRKLYGVEDLEKVKYYDDYYLSVKRSIL